VKVEAPFFAGISEKGRNYQYIVDTVDQLDLNID